MYVNQHNHVKKKKKCTDAQINSSFCTFYDQKNCMNARQIHYKQFEQSPLARDRKYMQHISVKLFNGSLLAPPSHPEQDFESARLVQTIHHAICGLCECNTNVPEQASEARIG